MTGVGFGGLVDLAIVLASGFLLCAWDPWHGYLRRQPPPIPYFTFLAVGVIWWVVAAALIASLAWVCGWSRICLPTFGEMAGFADHQRHGVNVLVSAVLVWLALLLVAEKIWSWILGWQVGGKSVSRRISEWSQRNLKGWEFEKKVNQAVSESIMVMLTLCNRKVYIGRPSEVSRDESGREKWISVVPWKSGYRCEKTGKLILTTDYGWMLRDQVHAETVGLFPMCIPIREVVSSQFFDQSLYERFQLGAGRTAAGNLGEDNERGEQTEESEQGAAETRSARLVDGGMGGEQGANRQ